MRRRVLGDLHPRPPQLSDRLYGGAVLLGRPAPLAVRAVTVLLVLASLVAATGVAAADSLPDEPLYAVKLVTEQTRLALATTAEDRATVELSIAEHRLTEALRLAEAGREEDALEASSAYGTHLASAAAELATIEVGPRGTALTGQLETRLSTQRTQVAATATRLAKDPRSAPAAAVLATVTATATPVQGATAAARIAANAAAFSERAAKAAEDRWQTVAPPPAGQGLPLAGATARAGTAMPTARAVTPPLTAPAPVLQNAPRTPAGTGVPSRLATTTPARVSPTRAERTVDPVAAKAAAVRAREAADLARHAAEAATWGAKPNPRNSQAPSPAVSRPPLPLRP